MKAHTSGPWSAHDSHGLCVGSNEFLIADLSSRAGKFPPDAENRSNADLITAAPDMYDTLVFVQKYAKMRADKGDPLPGQLVASVAAALAKAKS